MLTIRIPILAALLLTGCGRESGPDPERDQPRDTTISIDAHNRMPMGGSFSVSIQPDGAASIFVFRTTYDGRHWNYKFEGTYRAQLGPAAYDKLRNAIDELKVADLEQRSESHRLPCMRVDEPVLKIRSETQLDTEYVLYFSCAEHRDIALQLGELAMSYSDGIVQLDDWPLDMSQPP
jgi:hypothetical protein